MTKKTRLRWLVKERSSLGKRLSKQAVLRWWPSSKRKLLQRKERNFQGVDGDAKALLNATATVPFKFKQVT
jgi:hypothetical protein